LCGCSLRPGWFNGKQRSRRWQCLAVRITMGNRSGYPFTMPETLANLPLLLSVALAAALMLLALLYNQLRRARQQIAGLASSDSLTGLANRRSFRLLAEQALREFNRDQLPLTLLLLDLDDFAALRKQQTAGTDALLQAMARLLQDSLRRSDILARWDEATFICLLKNCNTSAALQVAEKLRLRNAQLAFSHAGVKLQAAISVGICQMQPGDSLDSLLAGAGKALERARQGGGDRSCSSAPGQLAY
jgi:diguanylate cyclase (GGDEF)-like protein